jgi:uncharacterized membrane protein
MSRIEVEERKFDRIIGDLLRVGVILAAIVVLTGGALFLTEQGKDAVNFRVFRGEAAGLHNLGEIISGAGHLHSREFMQLGLLLLIATPIARVLLSVLVFVLQRDPIYIVITLIVLGLLLFSLLGGMG